MTVFFIRHGKAESAMLGTKIFQGYGNNLAPLSEEGVRQIRETAKDVRLRGAELILSSPYTRALQSAAILSKELGIELAVEANLHEWVANKAFVYEEEAAAEQAYREFLANAGEYPAGTERAWEDAGAIRRRVLGVLERYAGHEKLIVVCHSMVMMAVTGQPRAENGEIVEYQYQ